MELFLLQEMAEWESPQLVRSATIVRDKLRLVLRDSSYIDFWWSSQIPGRFSHHWECRHVDGTVYRHDNMPHPRWRYVSTFPQHFDNGAQAMVRASSLPTEPRAAIPAFLEFAHGLIEGSEKCQ